MSQQPEAIRLAAVCDLGHPLEDDVALIGPELLRLHAVESGAKVELMRRDNLIDSLHGLCESYRTQVESLTRELYQATNPPFSGKTDSWQAACGKARTERDEARTQVESLQVEVNEQARLNGMGAERELALMAKVERLQAAGQVLDASEIYKRGWVACVGWAKRPDLIADIDSPAYANERAARLATPQPEPAWSPAYTRGPARQSAPVAAVPAMVQLTEEQMISAVRPLCNTGQVAERLVAVSIDEYRAIEAAIAKINGLTVGDGAHSGALHCKKCHADRAKEGCRNQYRDCPFTGNAQPIKDTP